MSRQLKVDMGRVEAWAFSVAQRIELDWKREVVHEGRMVVIHPIPRGGMVPAYVLLAELRGFGIPARIGRLDEAFIVVDDIVDSGETMRKAMAGAPVGAKFAAVIDKTDQRMLSWERDAWYVFPWEERAGEDETIEDNVRRLLQFIGEDPSREGLKETPARVAKAYREWFSGYGVEDPASILKVFEDGAKGVDEMVIVKDIKFYSHCEHHLAPFFGTVTIAYIPNGKIVGLSKFHRLVEVFARRLQVQERLTQQIAEVLESTLAPKGVAVLISARHLCVESRGARHTNSETVTNALRGVFKTSSEARAEFLKLAK